MINSDLPFNKLLLWDKTPPFHNPDDTANLPFLVEIRPAQPNGTAVIICPGGGYEMLVYEKEGIHPAMKFVEIGCTCFILFYRHRPYGHPIPLYDAIRSMRLVRSLCESYGFRSDCIGIMGFSAGGHVAALTSTHADDGEKRHKDPIERVGSHADFVILVYPVISGLDYAHARSIQNIVGSTPSPSSREEVSAHLHVTQTTPPTIITRGRIDPVVPVENALLYYDALQRNTVKSHLLVEPYTEHGYGFTDSAFAACRKFHASFFSEN
ncbi:MAG: prolyl oligopeptidase family serine peptidase [Chitinivibrionales bacterium]|nr:prolyl oligopeptidase family serine peptidase [Chitinivibrionales bacterium]